MASKISTELLIMILNNVQSTQDLHSSLLVNRIWCKVTIPILWELPLGQKFPWFHDRKALCIRTYISCMDTQTRTLLVRNGFNLSSLPPQATFDYPSFTHKFRIDNLFDFISEYLPRISPQQIIGPDQDNKNSSNENGIILFREIFKLIIERCEFVNSFTIESLMNFFNDPVESNDLFGSILKLPDVPKVFKKLEDFTLIIRNDDEMMENDDEMMRNDDDMMENADELICPLYESLTLICENILNMSLSFNSDFQMQLLIKFISAQKLLENLSIIGSSCINCNSLLLAIISQKETLKSLHLSSVNFYNFEWKSSPIPQFTSLQELYIKNCPGLDNSDCLSMASSFTQLSSFCYIYSNYKLDYPREFIIKIFETANTKLRNIYLNDYTIDTFSAILNYCTNITKLTLYYLSLENAIEIFNNNFNELRKFSFDCLGNEGFDADGFDADELLYQMAENVPESLETIQIRMDYHNDWTFSADSLRKFFKGWCCEGNGRNKKIIVKRSEKSQFKLSNEHSKVIEEYGVEFKLKLCYDFI